MSNQMKLEMKKKARTIKGLVALLKDDADYIYSDVNDFDMIGLSVSINEVKDTLQRVIDNVTELEYALYLSKREDL